MPHFYIEKNNIKENLIELTDKETLCHLVSALRVKENEIIKFIDEDEFVYKTKIISVKKIN